MSPHLLLTLVFMRLMVGINSHTHITSLQNEIRATIEQIKIILTKNEKLIKEITNVPEEYKKNISQLAVPKEHRSMSFQREIDKLKMLSYNISVAFDKIKKYEEIELQNTVSAKEMTLGIGLLEEDILMLRKRRSNGDDKRCYALEPPKNEPLLKPFQLTGIAVLHGNKSIEDVIIVLTIELKEQKSKLSNARRIHDELVIKLQGDIYFYQEKHSHLLTLIINLAGDVEKAKNTVSDFQDNENKISKELTDIVKRVTDEEKENKALQEKVKYSQKSLLEYTNDMSCYKILEDDMSHIL